MTYVFTFPERRSETVKVSSKGRITLPKALRDKRHLQEGRDALVVDTEAGILVPPRPDRSLYGMLKGRVDSVGVEQEIRKLRSGWPG